MSTFKQPFLIHAATFLLVFASLAHAQEATPLDEGVIAGGSETAIPSGEVTASSIAIDNLQGTDPLVEQDIMGLRESGIVDLQSRIGKDLIVIDRLQRRAEALEGMIATLGVEGLKQFDPELYEALKDSPLVLNQLIEEEKLRRDLEKVRSGEDEENSAPPDMATLDPLAFFQQGGASALLPPPVAPAPELETESSLDLGSPEDLEMEDIAPPAPVVVTPMIAVREIYGRSESLTAVITLDAEEISVQAGDFLPNDVEILSVFENRISVRQGDQTFEVFLRG